MQIELSCAMCGREKMVEADTNHAGITTVLHMVEKVAKSNGWIVQQNGAHLDLYCSSKCAK